MLKISSFFKGFYKLIKSIPKKLYRTCAVISSCMLIIAVIALSSKDFGGAGKNRVIASDFGRQTVESETEDEDSMALGANDGFVETGVEQITSEEASSSEINIETTTASVEENTSSAEVSVSGGISQQDYDVLCRIVQAEAGGEDDRGKQLVANVVLNRVKSDIFPDTITDVVYDRCYGVAQFQPTTNGKLDSVQVADSTRESVDRALAGEDYSQGALYFAVKQPSTSWFNTDLQFLFEYSGHYFYK